MQASHLIPARLRQWLWGAAIAACSAQAQAPADVRVALLIGNSSYPGAPLVNPQRDVRAMAEALSRHGFQVRPLVDATREQMQKAVADLAGELRGKRAVGLLYYAGHGMQLDYDNLLLPVDANVRSESDLRASSVRMDDAIAALRSADARLGIIVLDACRDNPFRPAGAVAGLAPRDPPRGMVVAYATEPGNVAQDGDPAAGNGLYTRHLLQEMARGGATIDDVFKRVRYAVWRGSSGTQIPSYSNGAEEDFSLDRGFATTTPASDRERQARFEREKAHWDRVRGSRDPADYFAFIDAWPHSAISELAQASLERLARRTVLAQAERGQARQNPADSRFREGDSYRMELRRPGQAAQRFSIEVREVRDDVARYTNVFGAGRMGESTVAGAVISDGQATFDPPYVLVPGGEYQVGKRWSGRSMRRGIEDGRTQWMDYSGRVVARETIEVPAGRMDTYRVEFQWKLETGPVTRSTTWVQPEWGIGVRTDFEFVAPSGAVIPMSRVLLERRRTG